MQRGDESQPRRRARPDLSVVVPLMDEEEIVPALVERLARVLDSLECRAEVILVDDGSRDGTLSAIARAHATDRRFVGLSLSRNFGHQAAISAGLAHARGDAVVVMDGDLQDPPEAIGPLLNRLRDGFDVVYAVRNSRPEGPLKRAAYAAFYSLLGRTGSIAIPRDAGDFGIMSRRVVRHLNALPERTRFVRGLRAWVGFRQVGLPIDRGPRHGGRPKYTAAKLVALALDGLIGFGEAPLRWAGGIGLLATLAGMLGGVIGALAGLGGRSIPSWLLPAAIAGFLGGAQLISVAILGEYVSRILREVHGRPTYVVRRRIGVRTMPADRRTTEHRTAALSPSGPASS